MQIQVNTDHNIEGREGLAEHVRTVVEKSLKKVGDRVTRVEVHLTDENSGKGGAADKRCVMEARVERHQPTAVTHHAPTINLAIDGAADKLERALTHLISRLRDNR
jgi:ribosome-associated translation inhibitor RaiA